jgi:hypothetical protein
MDSARQAGRRTTQQEGGVGTVGDKQVADNVRRVMQGNPDNTTREWGWRTWDHAKGGGNGDGDNEEEQYNPCGGNDNATLATRTNPSCTKQKPTNDWSSKGRQ